MQFFRTLFGKGIEYNRNSIGNLNYFVMEITETRFFAAAVASLAALLFAFQICAGASAGMDGGDDEGHVLKREWRKYDEAVEKDLPQTASKTLEDIMAKAESRRLAWDFCDAVRKYYGTVSAFDWKQARTLDEVLKERVEKFGSAVVTWNFADVWPLYTDRADIKDIAAMKELQKERNPQFYGQDRYIGNGRIPEVIAGNIGNDYEYLLWSAFMYGYYSKPVLAEKDSSGTFDAAADILEKYLGSRYPESAYVEFIRIMRIPADTSGLRKSALEAFAEEYHGKGAGFFARQELISMKFSDLDASDDAVSSDFEALRDECEAFVKDMESLRGSEAELVKSCTFPADLMKKMDSRRISAWIENGTDTLHVALTNLDGADVSVYRFRGYSPEYMDSDISGVRVKKPVDSWADSTAVLEMHLSGTPGRYYIPDTLSVALPEMDDRNYYIVCRNGEVAAGIPYYRRTISIAYRCQDGGTAFYPADYMSGRPVGSASVSVYQNDSLVGRIRRMPFNGFTELDGIRLQKNARYGIICFYTDENGIFRQSRGLRFIAGAEKDASDKRQEYPEAAVYKNMAAFHPGDTLRYKVVLYEDAGMCAESGSEDAARSGRKVWTGKEPVIAELVDPSGNKVAEDTLYVNDFGSASGVFKLPEDRMNGRFSLKVKLAGMVLANDVLTVDEFVLPTFTVEFDPMDRVYFQGDTVTVSGRLASYAGQSLAAARVSCSVSLWNEIIQDGTLDIAPDGSFSLSFATGGGQGNGRRYYTAAIRVTDATGETQEFRKSIAVNDFFFGVELENDAGASVMMAEGWPWDQEASEAGAYDILAVSGDFAVAAFCLRNASGDPVQGVNVSYEIVHEGRKVLSGEALSGARTWLDLSSWPSGVFRLKASATVEGRTKECVYDLIKVTEKDGVLDIPVENFFKVLPSDGIKFQIGASAGPVWAVVQLFGDNASCLASTIVHLYGKCGKDCSLRTLSFDYKPEYPDAVRLQVFYFRNGQAYEFSHEFKRPHSDNIIPVSFSRFTDKAYPGEKCIYEISTLPGVECAVSVSDMTAESVMQNLWSRVRAKYGAAWVDSGYSAGRASASGSSQGTMWIRGGMEVTLGYGAAGPVLSRMASSPAVEDAVSAENLLMTKSALDGVMSGTQAVDVRDDFSEALAFYPFLRSDENGKISFEFTAGDKLSTYYVSLFVHDKDMNNNVLRREMQISLPVAVSLAQPAYLFSGDRYDMQVALSNVSGADSEGTLSLYLYAGSDCHDSVPMLVKSLPSKICAGSASSEEFSVEVPSGIDTLGVKVVYQSASCPADGGHESACVSDAIFAAIPVHAPEQALYESHSALLLPGMSRDSLYQSLLSQFVNVSGLGAASEEISIMDMLLESIPDHVVPESPDVISVMGACLASYLAADLTARYGGTETVPDEDGKSSAAELLEKVLSYQNAGGGFAWLKGAQSSPLVTAVVLEYISVLDSHGFLESGSPVKTAAERAVNYLDSSYFSDEKPWSGLSLSQYLFVRSLYEDLPLTAGLDRKARKAFAKSVKKYVFDNEADAPGYIHFKALRAMTLLNFITASQSRAASGNASQESFLNSLSVNVSRKFISSLDRYMMSLKEYAAVHKSGGQYYPNAVMPFRGLLESELYAHSVLARLMSGYAGYSGDAEAADIAEGIRLWIMVQKETQSWDSDPACLLAIDAVMDGSAGLLDTKVMALTRKYRKPFAEIKPAGNDVSLRCRYLVEDDSSEGSDEYPGYRDIAEGEVLKVGASVLAVYEIWSAENRSYVRLTVPRPASLRPEDQLSGMYRAPMRPRGGAMMSLAASPYAYREVKSGCSRWFMEVLPEERTVLTEKLTVTQAGVFSIPAADIECLYAPHYRANDGFHPRLESVK